MKIKFTDAGVEIAHFSAMNALTNFILNDWDGKPFVSSARAQSLEPQAGEEQIVAALKEAGVDDFLELPGTMYSVITAARTERPEAAQKIAAFCGTVVADQMLIWD